MWHKVDDYGTMPDGWEVFYGVDGYAIIISGEVVAAQVPGYTGGKHWRFAVESFRAQMKIKGAIAAFEKAETAARRNGPEKNDDRQARLEALVMGDTARTSEMAQDAATAYQRKLDAPVLG